MNQTLRRQITTFLNVAGSLPESVENSPLLKLSRDEWKGLLSWLDDCGLTLTCWKRLKEAGEERAVPPEVRVCVEQNFKDHRLRIVQMLSEFASINRCLEEAGVTYAVLKGFALIPEYCPDIFLRTSFDYDYLVAPESESRAERALSAAGFLRKDRTEDHPVVYFHNARRPRSPIGRNDLYSAAFPRTIELHHLFWDSGPLKIPLALPGNPLARLELRQISPNLPSHPPGLRVHFHALSREDELLFQVLHAFRHILRNWCRLSSLREISYFIHHRALDAVFWDRFHERLRRSRPLQEIVGVVFLLAATVFGATIPDPVSAQVMRSLRRPFILWVERYGQDSALNNFSDNKFSLFLHREFIQDQAAWREIRRTWLLPIRRPSGIVKSGVSLQLSARWKQGCYHLERLKHHVMAAARYGLESPRWYRARMRRQ